MTSPVATSSSLPAAVLPVRGEAGFGLISLRGASPLVIQLLPNGAVYAIRHRGLLVSQVLPGPAEQGMFRLLLREREGDGQVSGRALAGAGVPVAHADGMAGWATASDGLECRTTLELHPLAAAWRWRIRLRNNSNRMRSVDVLHAQDIGLGDEAAVRNNEAYSSQYLDFLPVRDDALGWTLLIRQNQPAAGGLHPWLAFACVPGAEGYGTDASQFFGRDHRLTGRPIALAPASLPSTRLQYECAMAALQSRRCDLDPGADCEVEFLARLLEHHPDSSAAADVALIRELAGTFPDLPVPTGAYATDDSLFVRAAWLHGESADAADLARWFPGSHREVERDAAGQILSFFCGEATHVVSRAKEALVARPHGHILRSGEASWIDDRQFGVTVYAAGVFGAQAYLGNPSLARLLPVVRDALGVLRGSGQRVFVRRDGQWLQLGVPTAFAVTPGEARWIYRLGGECIQLRVWCSRDLSASLLEIVTDASVPCEFLVTHQLALGANEFDQGGTVQVHAADGWAACALDPEGFTARHLPSTCFAIAGADPQVGIAGDEVLHADGRRRHTPYLALRLRVQRRAGVILLGVTDGADALPAAVAAARRAFATDAPAAEPRPLALRLAGSSAAGVGRINEVLPWFHHNAAIHFSAPHGLEQYGGAAWGVRDVCQGSLEWLIASGQLPSAGRMLTTVFAQQYRGGPGLEALGGSWPQWFMFQPFHALQQAHSHGDVCFWPVKALCDYVEASGDLNFPASFVGYTSAKTFAPEGPLETLWAHCDRVVAHVESRFVPGTALVNYGDGDWDDTLQPADPAMRTKMVSTWTVGLAYHTLRQLAELCRRARETTRLARLEALLRRMRADFARLLMPGGIVAGFVVMDANDRVRPLLHPEDSVTGIRYRLLPMTRSILAELFTPEEARRHLEVIEAHLRYPDGVRLMSEPAAYHGGVERLFQRAETAANVGREIGLQYVHAHLRYAEALAKVGEAERLWQALQTVNPVGLQTVVPNAAPRQSNVYFSSSDADFDDRYEAIARWSELRSGAVAVRGGWRLYSSGPGLFVHKVRSCLLGVREYYDSIVFDPVLPWILDGLSVQLEIRGAAVRIVYYVRQANSGPAHLTVNGIKVQATREPNPYRTGGLVVHAGQLASMLQPSENQIEVEL